MSEAIKNIELIEQYCEGKLTAKEKGDFENRLLSDVELKEELDLYNVIVAGIKENGEDNLKARLKIVDKELDSIPAKVIELKAPQKSYFKYFAIASAIALIVGLGLYWQFSSTMDLPQLADTYYEKDKGLPIEMSASKKQLDEVMNNYKSVNYEKAKTQLELMLRHNLGNDTIKYYYGVINYELADYKASNATLSEIKSDSYFFEKAQYRLILGALKTKNKRVAIERIDACLVNKNHLYYNKLVKLKEELTK